jgi:hypothetical protein
MKTKAIKDLCRLPDKQLFEMVSKGLSLIVDNAHHIEQDSHILTAKKRPQGYKILQSFAAEEAAKFFILIDAVRCPRQPAKVFSRQLSYFDQHLAKGIYSYYFWLRPHDFGKVREWIESETKEYYLDGPEGFDWIFRNEIIRKREEIIYVDFVESDGQNYWTSPGDYRVRPILPIGPASEIPVLKLARLVHGLGCTTPGGLEQIAKLWRKVSMKDDFDWKKLREMNIHTLRVLENQDLFSKTPPQETTSFIVDRWLFPLYSLDLGKVKVDKNELREIQEKMAFDLYY